MFFGFTDDQVALADALSDVLVELCPADVVRTEWETPGIALSDLWKSLGGLGIFGLLQPQSAGGLGGTQVDLVLMLETCGRFAVPGPIAEHISVAVPAACAGSATSELVGALVGGELIATATEPGRSRTRWAEQSSAVLLPGDGGWSVAYSGEFDVSPTDANIDRSITEGVVHAHTTSILCDPSLMDETIGNVSLAVSAQLVGLATSLIEMTRSYVLQRRQFGVAVGAQQAIKHRLADALISLEHARPVLYNAAYRTSVNATDTKRDISHARIAVAQAAELASTAALQCHGAIGYTWEHDLHMWFKRVMALVNSWGAMRDHLEVVATAVVGAKPEAF